MERATGISFKTHKRKLEIMKEDIYRYRIRHFAYFILKCKVINDLEESVVGWTERIPNPQCIGMTVNMGVFRLLPFAFPNEWLDAGYFSEMFGPVMTDYKGDVIIILNQVKEFFGMTNEEVAHCFSLDHGELQDCEKYNGIKLYSYSTPANIARNLLELAEVKNRNKN
ncbi:MAG: hypothetical protein ACXVNM_01605 [Bacteroidia bacterium]